MNALPCLIVSGLCLSVAARAATPTVALALGNPRAVAVDAARNLYVGDVESAKIYRIAADGQVTVLGAGGPAIGDPIGLAVDRSGNVYAADADGGAVYRIPAGGAAAALGKSGAPGSSANFSTPTSVAVDASGNVYVANNGANTVLRVTPDGTISDFAGRNGVSGSADGKGSAALFAAPRGLAVDGRGNVYVADEGNCNIRRIAPGGAVTPLTAAPKTWQPAAAVGDSRPDAR